LTLLETRTQMAAKRPEHAHATDRPATATLPTRPAHTTARKQAAGVATAQGDGINGQTTGASQASPILASPLSRCGVWVHDVLTRSFDAGPQSAARGPRKRPRRSTHPPSLKKMLALRLCGRLRRKARPPRRAGQHSEMPLQKLLRLRAPPCLQGSRLRGWRCWSRHRRWMLERCLWRRRRDHIFGAVHSHSVPLDTSISPFHSPLK